MQRREVLDQAQFFSDAVRPGIAAFALILVGLIWFGANYLATQDRVRVIEGVHTTSANLARAFEEHTTRSLGYAGQLSLQLKRQYERLGTRFDLAGYFEAAQIDPDLVHNAAISDARGDVVLSSIRPLARANLADRDHVRIHWARDTGRIVVGKPILARLSGKWSFVVSRRINRPDGEFAGVVSVALNPFYFSDFYRQVDLGRLSMVGLLGLDGIVRALYRQGRKEGELGQDVREWSVYKNLAAAPHATLTAVSEIDGVRRIVSYRSLKDYPLVVAVGVAEAEALAEVDDRRALYLRVAILASVFVFAAAAGLIVLLTRQRRAAQAAQRAHGAQMTELQRAHERLRESDQRLQQAVRVADIGIFDHDHRAATIYWSPELRKIYGVTPEDEITVAGFISRLVPEDRERISAAVTRAHDPAGDGSFDVEHRVVRSDGELRWLATRSRTVFEDAGAARRPVRSFGAVIDITERKRTEQELQRLLEHEQIVARTDSLTGLPNRVLFQDRLRQAIASATRDATRHVAVLLMDLDNFKDINDTLGHPAGDQVLVQIARRLAQTLREEDTFTRLGGDEFAVLLPVVSAPPSNVENVVQKLIAALAEPVLYQDRELYVGASIGISLYPEHGEDAATLVAHADIAMYSAKSRRLSHLFYDPAMDSGVGARLQLSNELRHAIERGELFLEFQPKIDLASGRAEGAEALVRWQHPERGRVEPVEFVSLAERSGLIHALTDWVIERSIACCRGWRERGHDLHVAVNISGHTLADARFAERVMRALASSGLPAHCLELEITENTLMSDIDYAGQVLDTLYERGVRVSIDDFGTGYSSLAYLKRLPLHALKIDQSFVRDMARDGNDAAIVRSIIDLAHNLGRNAVAEGVEDKSALSLLELYGCDSAQGFFLGRPLADEQFQAWLAERAD